MSLHSLLSYALLLLATGYGVVLLSVFLAQSRLLYSPNVPSREVIITPQEVGLPYEPVTIPTEDDIELDAWLIPARDQHGVVAFFHGNSGNISHRLETLQLLHEFGLTTLIFDYRGYGRSGGTPSEQGTYRDAEAVWRYLTEERQLANPDIILFGRSLGGAIAAHLAARHSPGALILESAFVSIPKLAAMVYPYLPVQWISRYRYPTAELLESITCPVLIIHSREDEIVPFEHGQELFAQAKGPKEFLEIHGSHNDAHLVSHQAYIEGLAGFLHRHWQLGKPQVH